jgi:predicted alpha/beta superfamily hydrolase
MARSENVRRILASTLFLAALASLAPAAPRQQGNTNNDIVIGTRVPFPSKVFNADLVLSVHLPPGYEQGAEKYPVLYNLNSSQTFAHDAGTVDFLSTPGLGYAPQMIVVGVPWLPSDYVPTPFEERGPEPKASDLSLKFFREELMPFIDRTYRTCGYNILSGHSVGGLFTMYALFTQPDLFSAGIASSPAFGGRAQYWLKNLDKMFQAGSLAHKSLFLTVGKKEDDWTISNFTELEKWMGSKDLKGLTWKSARFDGHDHMSIVGRSVYDGLLFIFDGWKFPYLLVRSADIPAIEAHAAKVRERFGDLIDYKVPEDLLDTFGDMWLGFPSYDQAIRLASLNVKLYPEGWKPHYQLGEAFMAKGDKESARKNYELAAAKNKGQTDPEKIMLQITRAKLNPSRPTAKKLALYAGDYGQRKVSLEKGVLLYQETGPQSAGYRPPYRLIPLTETLFALDGLNNFWLEFVLTDGKVAAVVGLYNDGRRETSPRSK